MKRMLCGLQGDLKKNDSILEIYFWEEVYQVKKIFMTLERGAN